MTVATESTPGAACAIYTRVSVDPLGTSGSTTRQEENCRRFCSSREWSVVRVFEDIDESAFQPGGRRPAFEELIGHLSSGEFNTLVVWRLDRLSRRPAEFERIWAECERNGVAIASVTEPIDTSSESASQ